MREPRASLSLNRRGFESRFSSATSSSCRAPCRVGVWWEDGGEVGAGSESVHHVWIVEALHEASLLAHQVHLGHHIHVGDLQLHHGGKTRQAARDELAGVCHKLRVEYKHTANHEAPALQRLHNVAHNWHVRIEFHLSWAIDYEIIIVSVPKLILQPAY